ncbi:MAG: endonuclease MutS2 [Firmicutes bacterium]|nr:endonuclease MutS2 [Bacillota bacterium]MCL2256102.1 endonuclease MutS2 [Bacillota bacterium]
MIDERTCRILEFDKVLDILSAYAVSTPSKEEVLKTRPSTNRKEIETFQNLTQEAYLVKEKYNLSPIVPFDCVLEVLEKATIEVTLSPIELLKISRLLRSCRITKKEISSCGGDVVELKRVISMAEPNKKLEESIDNAIENENSLKDDASSKLKELRIKLRTLNNSIKEKVNSFIRSQTYSKYLQEAIVTIRDGRFVLPVKSEFRHQIPGLIHDQSATGSTVFIEPIQVVQMNNEIKSVKILEQKEIERILKELTIIVASEVKNIKFCQNACVMTDIVFAKCAYSTEIRGTEPTLNEKGMVDLKDARHPLIERSKVVPVSIAFGKDYKMLLITGPNTGGKTVALKTTGLMCLMAYIGLKVPCKEQSEIAIFDSIYCDIGDEQSIENALSTFSSHIVNIVNITNNLTNKSLVLFDEVGGGTDPIEGVALAKGIIKYLELMKACAVVTTHYPELKEYALLNNTIMNASMQFDEGTLKPTFKMVVGLPGTSNALKIASTLGINDYILKEANKSLDKNQVQFEDVLKRAQEAKARAMEELESAEALNKKAKIESEKLKRDKKTLEEKLEKIKATAQLETKRIISSKLFEVDEIMQQMKELQKQNDDEALFKARQLKRRIEDKQFLLEQEDEAEEEVFHKEVNPNTLIVGTKVVLKKFGTTGEIKSFQKGKKEAEVICGSVVTKVKLTDLALVESVTLKKPKQTNQAKVSKYSKPTAEKTEQVRKEEEIKVLGLTVFEAIEMIEPLIMLDITHIRVVHGKGTGALGIGVQDYFKKHKAIKSVRYGGYGEGDRGVTFLELR